MRHTGRYDFNMMQRLMETNAPLSENDVLDEIGKCNINGAVKKLHNCLNDIYKKAKIKQKKIDSDASVSMEKANTDYDNYKRCLNGQGVESPDTAFTKYQKSRNDITKEMYMLENARWKALADKENSKGLWRRIDWKGNINKHNIQRASAEKLATHFEALYKPSDPDEAVKISNLEKNTYIPILDDPVTQNDIADAMKGMTKGGYDYNLQMLQILVRMISPILLLLFNVMFYIEYPVSLAKSILVALPKKGNLLLAVNYRGIQMLAALGALFDRIIVNRLHR